MVRGTPTCSNTPKGCIFKVPDICCSFHPAKEFGNTLLNCQGMLHLSWSGAGWLFGALGEEIGKERGTARARTEVFSVLVVLVYVGGSRSCDH